MGYAFYTLPDGREAGYGVEATCDREGCTATIDRGLGYLCGQNPDGHRDPDEFGCGKYFCGDHSADHDCANPSCGEWSTDEMSCCDLATGHDAPHRDRDGTEFTEVFDGSVRS